MKKLILALLSFFIFLATFFIVPSSTLAVSWPPEVKPEQGKASWKTPVPASYDGRILGESYTEVLFWNVGAVSVDPAHAKASVTNDCAKSTVPGCSGGGTTWGTFSGGPNGTLTISGYEYKLHDGQYFEGVSGGNTFKFSVENPEIFTKYNWELIAEESKLEDSGVRFSDLSGQVEVLIPLPDGSYDEGAWNLAKLGMVLPVGTRIRTEEDTQVILSFPDMTTFTMGSETQVILSSPKSQDTALKLLLGNLMVNVKKMMKDGSMEVEMSQAVAGIKGTRFVLSETGKESTIKVTEGTVKYTSKSTGKSVDISKGESVVATTKGLSEKTAFNPDEEEKKWQNLADNKSASFIDWLKSLLDWIKNLFI